MAGQNGSKKKIVIVSKKKYSLSRASLAAWSAHPASSGLHHGHEAGHGLMRPWPWITTFVFACLTHRTTHEAMAMIYILE